MKLLFLGLLAILLVISSCGRKHRLVKFEQDFTCSRNMHWKVECHGEMSECHQTSPNNLHCVIRKQLKDLKMD